ncbi:MAG: hypothetical protein WD708_08155 [Kiritimatiellia bacterium]
MMLRTKRIFMLLSLVCLAGNAMAEVVFSEDFSDGKQDGWVLAGKSLANEISVSGEALLLSSTDTDPENNFSAVAAFPAVDLSVAGAKVTLELDFQNMEDHAFQRGIAIGLYDSRETAITSDSEDEGAGKDDWGYYMYTRRFPFMHRLYENNGKGILDASESANRANDDENASIRVNRDSAVENVFGIADGQWHSFRLEIKAVQGPDGEVDLDVTLTVDEGHPTESVMTYRDGGVLMKRVDQIGLMSMKGNDFKVDNLKVTHLKP